MGALPPDSRHADPVIQRLLDWVRGNLRFECGQGTIDWPGGSSESNLIAQPTGLPASDARYAAIVPEGPAPGIAAPRRALVGMVFDYDATKPTLQGRLVTMDAGLNPAPAATSDYFWIVVL